MEVSQRKESSLSIMLERERDMIITNVRLFLFILVEKKKKCGYKIINDGSILHNTCHHHRNVQEMAFDPS